MVYRVHSMWEVLDVLRRIHRGEKQRSVAKVTGRSRKAIRRYIRLATELGWKPGEGREPDEDLAARVAMQLKPGPRDGSAGETERRLVEHKERIKAWLEHEDGRRRGLTLTKVHILLERHGVQVPYGSLYRFAVKHLAFGKGRTTVRVAEVEPGELGEVDFGKLGTIQDGASGTRRVVYALVVTLVFSRHQYVHLSHHQELTDLIEGLEDAWEFFGGVPQRLVLDSLKAAVVKADRYEPAFQRTFNEYAGYRGFVINATLARHATGKPHVERQVPYVRENFFRAEDFLSMEQAQRAVRRWCLERAGQRIHGTTRKRPMEDFEMREKARLKPLEKERFDNPDWAEVIIHPDFHVRYQYALYSVPHQRRGSTKAERTVTIRAHSKMVRIDKHGQLIKTHPRKPPGTRSTDYGDYPAPKAAYAMRDVATLMAGAARRGPHLGRFVERLLGGTFPWAHLRQAQKLMRLADQYGNERVDAACKRALDFDLVNVKRVQSILESTMEKAPGPEQEHPMSARPLNMRFLRDPNSFHA